MALCKPRQELKFITAFLQGFILDFAGVTGLAKHIDYFIVNTLMDAKREK